MTTAPVQEASPRAPRVSDHRQIQVVMSGLMLGVLLAALDQTIVSTALTRISEDFHRPDLYSWVVTSYLLTSTATTPLYGKLSDLFGRKRIFQVAIVIFLLGSALCGAAQSMVQLIVFRGVQGLGAGGLISLALAIVGDIIPPRERGRYQGYFGAVFGASSVLGPLIGGFLVDQTSWRWVFYVNIPVGIVALVVIDRVLQLDHTRRSAKVDVVGALLLVTGVSLFLVAVQNSGRDAHVNTASLVFGVVGLLLVLAFVGWETRASEPILPLRLFGNSVFAVSALLSLITGAVMFGAIIFLPQYMQLVRGMSPTRSGLHLLPLLAGLLLTSIGSGRLISRIGRYKVFVVVGTAVLSIGLGLLTGLAVDTSFWTISAVIFLVGVGLGLFMQTLVLATQNAVEHRDLGTGTSAVTFFRTLGGALGASVLGAILISHQRTVLPAQIAAHGRQQGPLYAFTDGVDRAYLWAVPIALIAFLLSFALRDLRLRASSDAPGPQSEERVAGQDAAAATVGGAEQALGSDLVGDTKPHDGGRAVETQQHVPAQPAGSLRAGAAAGATAAVVPRRGAGAPSSADGTGRVGARSTADGTGRAGALSTADGTGRAGALSSTGAPATATVTDSGSTRIAVPAPAATGPAGADGPVVWGRVSSPDGTPLAHASLTLTDLGGRQLARAHSHQDGTYRLTPASGGAFLLICASERYQPTASLVNVAGAPLHQDVALTAATRVRGRVTAEGTTTLAEAFVTLTDVRGQVVGSAMTDRDGGYLLDDLVAGDYTLTATADRHQPSSQTLSLPESTTIDVDISLVGSGEVAGVVRVAGTGQPLPGAMVTVVDGAGAVVGSGLTDGSGHYHFGELSPGSYTVTSSGYAPVAAHAHVSGGRVAATDLTLGQAAPEVSLDGAAAPAVRS